MLHFRFLKMNWHACKLTKLGNNPLLFWHKQASPTTSQKKNQTNPTNPFCYSRSILWYISKPSQTWNNQQIRHGTPGFPKRRSHQIQLPLFPSISAYWLFQKHDLTRNNYRHCKSKGEKSKTKTKIHDVSYSNEFSYLFYTLLLNSPAKSVRILSLVVLHYVIHNR